MTTESDARIAALIAAAGSAVPPALVSWLLQGLDALEQQDFGEIEPVGVGAPGPVT